MFTQVHIDKKPGNPVMLNLLKTKLAEDYINIPKLKTRLLDALALTPPLQEQIKGATDEDHITQILSPVMHQSWPRSNPEKFYQFLLNFDPQNPHKEI